MPPTRTNIGLGAFGHFGMAQEANAAYGTAVAASVFLPIKSESIALTIDRPADPGIEAIPWNKRNEEGKHSVAGAVQLDLGGANMGYPLKMCERGITSNAHAQVSGITAAVGAGGTLEVGAHYYKVYVILNRTADSVKYPASASTEVLATVAATANATATLSWTNPTPPAGHTIWGHLITKTAVGGATGSELCLISATGATAVTYADTGTPAYSATAASAPDDIYIHTIESDSTKNLNSFTAEIHPDTGSSRQVTGLKAKGFKLGFDVNSGPFWDFSLDVVGKDEVKIAKTAPSYTDPKSFSAYKTMAWLNTTAGTLTANTQISKFELAVDNGLQESRGANYTDTLLAVDGGFIKTTANFTINCTGMDEYDRFLAATQMQVKVLGDGPPTSLAADGTAWAFTSSGITLQSYPYQVVVTVPQVLYKAVPHNIGGQATRLALAVAGEAQYNTTMGSDHTIELVNKIASYPDT